MELLEVPEKFAETIKQPGLIKAVIHVGEWAESK